MVYHDVSFGALTQLYAGTTAEGVNLNGKVSPSLFRLNQDLSFDSILSPGHALEIHLHTHRIHSREWSYGNGSKNRSRMFKYSYL